MNKETKGYFSKFELLLWSLSAIIIIVAFIAFDRSSYLTLIASLIGVTSLIFNAKGNPIGQLLMVVFSVLYGIISFSFAYYGEMITYLGMTAPMAIVALVAWLKNPYKGNKSQVTINKLSKKEIVFAIFLSAVITVVLYFVLKYFNTTNLMISTLSVFTSFFAAYLTFRRSPLFALAYGLNDIVLIAMWILAFMEKPSYVSVIICFLVFLVNDLYGFFNWFKLQKHQKKG